MPQLDEARSLTLMNHLGQFRETRKVLIITIGNAARTGNSQREINKAMFYDNKASPSLCHPLIEAEIKIAYLSVFFSHAHRGRELHHPIPQLHLFYRKGGEKSV